MVPFQVHSEVIAIKKLAGGTYLKIPRYVGERETDIHDTHFCVCAPPIRSIKEQRRIREQIKIMKSWPSFLGITHQSPQRQMKSG